MAKKRKKAKKAKLASGTEVVQEPKQELVAKIPGEVWVQLNEVEVVQLLRGDPVFLKAAESEIKVTYLKHKAVTPAGLAMFWADVERLAQAKRKELTASAPVIAALSRDIDMSLRQAQDDREVSTGVALRSSPEAVEAVESGSFIPPNLRQIAANLKSQNEAQQNKTPEERRLTTVSAAPALENKGGADGKEK